MSKHGFNSFPCDCCSLSLKWPKHFKINILVFLYLRIFTSEWFAEETVSFVDSLNILTLLVYSEPCRYQLLIPQSSFEAKGTLLWHLLFWLKTNKHYDWNHKLKIKLVLRWLAKLRNALHQDFFKNSRLCRNTVFYTAATSQMETQCPLSVWTVVVLNRVNYDVAMLRVANSFWANPYNQM